jgi:hypothetical protein
MNDGIEAMQNKMTELPKGFDNFGLSILSTNDKIDETNNKLDITKNKVLQVKDALSTLSSSGATSYSANENIAGAYNPSSANIGDTIWNWIQSLFTSSNTHHSGVNAGTVGNKTSNISNEFISLLKEGEVVVDENQMSGLMTKTLPKLSSMSSSNTSSTITIEKLMDLNVNGNLDSSVLPEVEKMINSAMDKSIQALSQRGIIRTGKAMSI